MWRVEGVLRMSVWVSKVCLPSITPSLYLPLPLSEQVNEPGESDGLWRDDTTDLKEAAGKGSEDWKSLFILFLSSTTIKSAFI